jgi:CAAX protease family protein
MIVFKGSNGVRSGWRFLAYVAIVVGLNYLIGLIAEPLFKALHVSNAWLNVLGPGQLFAGEVLFAVPVIVATVVMARLERRSILAYGFMPSPRSKHRFFEGVLLGVIAPGIVGVLMIAFGGMRVHGLGLSGTGWIVYPLGWIAAMLMVGFFEEACFRGYPLYALDRGIGFWPAAIVVTLLFGAAHLSKLGENAVDISSVVLLGLFMCYTLLKTGSLWLAAGFHFAFDFMQFFVIGTRNGSQAPQGTLFNVTFPGPAWVNGGPLGTEASYFAFPVTLALFAYVAWRFSGRNLAVKA